MMISASRRGTFLRLFGGLAAVLLMAGCPAGTETEPEPDEIVDAVTAVRIDGEASFPRGWESTFSAVVTGTGDFSDEVVWSILEEDRHPDTVISADGVLALALDEELTELHVVATSVFDETRRGMAAVWPLPPEMRVLRVVVSSTDIAVELGGTLQFSASVEGILHPPQAVVWSLVETAASSGTSINHSGVLTVGYGDSREMLTVRATSVEDPRVFGDITIAIVSDPELRRFWVFRGPGPNDNEISARLMAVNEVAEVWVEVGWPVTHALAEEIASDYLTIHRRIVDVFGRQDIELTSHGEDMRFDDIIGFSDWWLRGDEADGRVTVLLTNLGPPQGGGIVMGMFHGRDWFHNDERANLRPMFYVNTFALGYREGVQATLAHELVHLINFAEWAYAINFEGRSMPRLDLWIDEALAENSHYVYFGENPDSRIDWFVADRGGTISRGNNMFIWNSLPSAIIDSYATAYLFLRWLYLHALAAPGFDESRFFNRLVSEATMTHANQEAITLIAREINPAWASWETLLKTWHAANFDAGNPVFGYLGDDELRDRLRVRARGEEEMLLRQAEGVFSHIGGAFTPPQGSGPNIRYVGFTPGDGTLSFGGTMNNTVTGSVLLTLNVNTVRGNGSNNANQANNALRETGFLSGNPPPYSFAPLAGGTAAPAEPFPLSVWDFLGIDRDEEPPVLTPPWER